MQEISGWHFLFLRYGGGCVLVYTCQPSKWVRFTVWKLYLHKIDFKKLKQKHVRPHLRLNRISRNGKILLEGGAGNIYSDFPSFRANWVPQPEFLESLPCPKRQAGCEDSGREGAVGLWGEPSLPGPPHLTPSSTSLSRFTGEANWLPLKVPGQAGDLY
jgi:hypothetical protein